MKKILATLALLVFVSSIDAVVSRTSRTARKGNISDEGLLGNAHNPVDSEHSPSASSKKEHISILRQKIKDAHMQVDMLHKNIADWTRELTPLEVQHNHTKSLKKPAA